MSMVVFQNNNKYTEHKYKLEKDFEDVFKRHIMASPVDRLVK